MNPLREALEALYRTYDESFLPSDPLVFAHRYERSIDREAVAFLAAHFAFGNVRAIFSSLERVLVPLGNRPVDAIREWPFEPPEVVKGWGHRWLRGEDIHHLLRMMREIYRNEGSIEALFSPDLSTFVSQLQQRLLGASGGRSSRGLRFLFPTPGGGSGCKRMNLFLRWVVRRERPDLGLWNVIPPSELLLPVDTHVARIVRYVGLSARRTTDWKLVLEATGALRRFDPADPIRYDFALARLGIVNDCVHRADVRTCPKCPLRSICILNGNQF